MSPEQVPNMMAARAPILMIYQPGKQAAVPNALSCITSLHDYMDESADSQPSGVG